LKLNIGCGDWYRDGWVNTDIDPLVKADHHCSMHVLPFHSESVSEIFAGHVIEHDSREMSPVILAEWFRVLKAGGRLTVVIPDILKTVDLRVESFITGLHFDSIAMGGEDRTYQRHKRLTFASEMAAEMISAGFREVQEIDDYEILVAKVNWQSIIQGVK